MHTLATLIFYLFTVYLTTLSEAKTIAVIISKYQCMVLCVSLGLVLSYVQSQHLDLYSHSNSTCTVTAFRPVQSQHLDLYSHSNSTCTVTAFRPVQSQHLDLYSHSI